MKLKSLISRRYHTSTNTSLGLLLVSGRTKSLIKDDINVKWCLDKFSLKTLFHLDSGTLETQSNLFVRLAAKTRLIQPSWWGYHAILFIITKCIHCYYHHNLIIFNTTMSIQSLSASVNAPIVIFITISSSHQHHIPSFSNIDFYPMVHSRLASRESKLLDTNALLFSVST